jgi:hypothetical protein
MDPTLGRDESEEETSRSKQVKRMDPTLGRDESEEETYSSGHPAPSEWRGGIPLWEEGFRALHAEDGWTVNRLDSSGADTQGANGRVEFWNETGMLTVKWSGRPCREEAAVTISHLEGGGEEEAEHGFPPSEEAKQPRPLATHWPYPTVGNKAVAYRKVNGDLY